MNIADKTDNIFNDSLLILHSLTSESEMSGIEISRFIINLCSNKYSIKLPTLYSELDYLETQNYVQHQEKSLSSNVPRKYYSIDDSGRSYLNDNIGAFNDFIESLKKIDIGERNVSDYPDVNASPTSSDSSSNESVSVHSSDDGIYSDDIAYKSDSSEPEEPREPYIKPILTKFSNESMESNDTTNNEFASNEDEPSFEYKKSAEDNIQLSFFDKNDTIKVKNGNESFSSLGSILGFNGIASSQYEESPTLSNESNNNELDNEKPLISSPTETSTINPQVFKEYEEDKKETIIRNGSSSIITKNKKNFINVANALESETYDTLIVKKYDPNVAKEYKRKYYVYHNKMHFINSSIIFALMILELLIPFLFIEVVSEVSTIPANGVMLILGALVSAIFPFYFTIQFLLHPYEIKRYYYRNSMKLIPKFIIFAAVVFIDYLIHFIIMGSPFDVAFLYTMLVPALLASNYPIYYLVNDLIYRYKLCEITD